MSVRVGIEATALRGPRAGVGTYIAELLAALRRVGGPELELVLFGDQPAPRPASRAARWLWVQRRLATRARRGGCDVLHCPNGMGPLSCATPLVLTLHDLSLFRHPESHPRTRLLSTRRLLPRLARRAAAVVAPSDFTRGEILDLLQLPAERVHTVPLAAAGHFQPVRDPAALGAVRDRYRLPPRFALFVGTLEPRKNLHRLVRAFHAVRARGLPHELILAGPSGWLMDGFARDVERLGLATVVRHIGYVPTADLAALYSLAELFVYPSLYEGFGLPALEAMACRTPVLTSDGSGLAEVCGDAAWRVDPLDQAALAEALYRLLDDRELREALARRGLARAGDFSWDRAARQTMTIYRQVAAHRR